MLRFYSYKVGTVTATATFTNPGTGEFMTYEILRRSHGGWSRPGVQPRGSDPPDGAALDYHRQPAAGGRPGHVPGDLVVLRRPAHSVVSGW